VTHDHGITLRGHDTEVVTRTRRVLVANESFALVIVAGRSPSPDYVRLADESATRGAKRLSA